MEKYNVGGMSCAACSTRVEKAVSKVEGVNSCAVSLFDQFNGR
jgi:Cu2+-exporting ATPase